MHGVTANVEYSRKGEDTPAAISPGESGGHHISQNSLKTRGD